MCYYKNSMPNIRKDSKNTLKIKTNLLKNLEFYYSRLNLTNQFLRNHRKSDV